MADVHALLRRLYGDLDQLPPAEARARLRARLLALGEHERARLDRWAKDNEEEVPLEAGPPLEAAGPSEADLTTLFPAARHARAYPGVSFDPLDLTYDDGHDLGAWLVTRGPQRLAQLLGTTDYLDAVRRHHRSHLRLDAPWSLPASGFRYPMPSSAEGPPLRLAIFGDAGLEVGPIRWLAPALAAWLGAGAKDRSFALHLGDIYYAGLEHEVRRFFDDMAPVAAVAELWTIPADHERFADGGGPFWKVLDEVRGRGWTRQQGGYFALENETFQILALDTFAGKSGEIPKDEAYDPGAPAQRPGHAQWAWLREALRRGEHRTNLVGTQYPPLRWAGAPRGPWAQLRAWKPVGPQGQPASPPLDRLHAWFWGDTHLAGVYRDLPDRPFVGFLAGHAGRPSFLGKPAPERARTAFWEREERYPPAWIDEAARTFPALAGRLQKLRGRVRNGWVQLLLKPGGAIDFAYVDWLGEPRFSGRITRGPAGSRLLADAAPTLVDDRTPDPP